MNIIISTGNEKRHEYFRKRISSNEKIHVLSSYCEGNERSLENRTLDNEKSHLIEIQHINARKQSEEDFFGLALTNMSDNSNPNFIKKGDINNKNLVSEIISQKPDLLICYGSSLIKSELIEIFKGSFLNVHLGLSPYYRGCGTNVWPLINNEPDMVGATFMYLDPGIDTGKIIHQIRADIFLGDSPHSIGNRLIRKMTETYQQLILNFEDLDDIPQPIGQGKLYLKKDFDGEACRKLYENFNNGMIEKFINEKKKFKYIASHPKLIS